VVEIKNPFDDDSHTFTDGPVERFFRMRKWAFAASVALLLLDNRWWDFETVAGALALSALPHGAVQIAVILAVGYLLLQSLIMIWQIALTYRQTLNARVKLIESDRLKALDEAIEPVRKEAVRAGAKLRALEGLSVAVEERTGTKTEYSEKSSDMEEYEQLLRRLNELEDVRASLAREHSRARSTLQLSEACLDAIRIVPTPFFLAYALFWHGLPVS
jgi:hypothetical protein